MTQPPISPALILTHTPNPQIISRRGQQIPPPIISTLLMVLLLLALRTPQNLGTRIRMLNLTSAVYLNRGVFGGGMGEGYACFETWTVLLYCSM